MLYTGLTGSPLTSSTNASVQIQCIAVPAQLDQTHANPILYPPPRIGDRDFRGPTTAWRDPSHRSLVHRHEHHASMAASPSPTRPPTSCALRAPPRPADPPRRGTWERIDFYPVAGGEGVDTTEAMYSRNKEVVHVMTASTDDDRHDYYALGRYTTRRRTRGLRWTPNADVGVGLRDDWGKFYASKTCASRMLARLTAASP
ncbi:hypothetical protein E2562_031096 [Oryza meyeriana var. granulata]|uniref:beta-fructofuranosidase n=1 Tax=Oryza meyeriana var. granulata TaxID=110450 RepID=A0A6G1E521_9ORYZ|nr:hypothetical protein E2562_031096 [Oryza meyeriana var. granulata]